MRAETVTWAEDGCGFNEGRGRGRGVGCVEAGAYGVSESFLVEVPGRFLHRA